MPAHELDVAEGYALWSAQYDTERNYLLAPEEKAVDGFLEGLSWSHCQTRRAEQVGTSRA